MKSYVFCGLLLASAVAAWPTTKDKNAVQETMEGKVDEFRGDLHVLDDNNNLVKIDLTEDYPETMDDTINDLENRVIFYLYTQNTRDNPEKLLFNDADSVKQSSFDPRKETKFITHGWINSYKSDSCTTVRDAFLDHGDHNVIVIDWSSISMRPYFWSSRRVVTVSKHIARMIDFLASQGMKASRTTIVGHSLGGHVAGLSSRYAKKKLNYVVALDPALPNFEDAGPGDRVSTGDGKYVEVIHTNSGGKGYVEAIGHVDFFPNGGRYQKGCIEIDGSCSHSRSFRYFAESVNSKVGFAAKRCSNYSNYEKGECNAGQDVNMGGVTPKYNLRGKYYLNTNGVSPFAQGHM